MPSVALSVITLLLSVYPMAADAGPTAGDQVVPLAAASTIRNLAVNPGAITILGTDPDLGVFPSSTISATWSIRGGETTRSWSLAVNSAAGGLSGCPTVPISAVRATCMTATISGGAGTATCAAPFTLTTGSQVLASGQQSKNNRNYQATLRLELTDSWRYRATGATQCSVSLTYTVNAP